MSVTPFRTRTARLVAYAVLEKIIDELPYADFKCFTSKLLKLRKESVYVK